MNSIFSMNFHSILLDLDSIAGRFETFNTVLSLQKVENVYEFDRSASAEVNLDQLSKFVLKPENTISHLFVYNEVMMDVVARWTSQLIKTVDPVTILESLARIITIYPLSRPFAEEFLAKHNEHFITILQNLSTQGPKKIQQILLAYYRFLYHDIDVFNKFINPKVLYALVDNESSDLIKFLSLKVLALNIHMSELALSKSIEVHIPDNKNPICGDYEMYQNVNYRFLELNEAKRFSEFSKLPRFTNDSNKMQGKKIYEIESTSFSNNVVSICGVLVPRLLSAQDQSSESDLSLVPTEKSISTLRLLAKNIQQSNPTMLIGRSGAGKTFLINELSKLVGCQNSIVKIHLGQQTDAKLLIGTYTSGEKPGTFKWRNGVLTTAVQEGRWVLIEDIDKAPTEVLSILLTLLEKRELSIPSRGEVIKAANGFQLISTVCISDEHLKRGQELDYTPNIIGMRIWKTIHLEEPNDSDLHNILCHNYPVLSLLIPKLILTYKDIKTVYLDPRFVSLNRGAHSRTVSVRDLVKLCNRLNTLFENNNITKPDQLLETTIYDNIFAEATDCFAGAISEAKALQPLIHAIGTSLEIPPSRINLFLTRHVPEFEISDSLINIGRATLQKSSLNLAKKSANITSFATTNHSLKLMEHIAVSVQMSEPVLLVGETGTGKTTVVQQLAKLVNKPLTVINVSQQTETGDLLGGYKPVNAKTVAVPVQEYFETLFQATFSVKKNEKFYKMLHRCFNKNQWRNTVKLWKEAVKMAKSILKIEEADEQEEDGKRKKRKLNSAQKLSLLEKWSDFEDMIRKFESQADSLENSFVFNFVEGSLVKAVKNGEWLLLDEVNLASADTLESISDLLADASSRSILLSEKGDAEPIIAHPEFKLFACMNPATDVGKRDLPPGIRSRFTEIYVHSPDNDINDLLSIIDKYIGRYSINDEWVGNDIAELYLEAKKLAEKNLIVDGSNQKPHFSIRTLTRTLLYVCDIIPIYGLRRSLYDGFCMSFLTLLDQKSEKLLIPIIEKYTLGRLKNMKAVMGQAPPCPGEEYVNFKHYWVKRGKEEIQDQSHYIMTPFVEKNLLNLVRATAGKRFPILIQGPTSAGKTSMIKHLADVTGHKFVRINNHEHTDLQEYLGTYVTDDSGKLSFREGILVEALRKGFWIVLDELNLAPTDVLEALNRLLDDNRELFIPETQEVVHPHPDFMLFATQNPPGIYGGRKVLSRAFRNRFLELHFDDIPQDELEIILRERCQIAPTYAKKIVEVYRQLSVERSASRLFEQKNSFATLRDLFRWALRDAVGYEQLAANGYMLLAERCRTNQEKSLVKNVLEKVMRVKLDMDNYYESLEVPELYNIESNIVWTKAMRRLVVLVSTSLKNNEPILLVGETGCGKTTICQLLSIFMNKKLITLNAHQNTETGDILGAQRPLRNRSELQSTLNNVLRKVLLDQVTEELDLDTLITLYDSSDKSLFSPEDKTEVKYLRDKLNRLFEWNDGPLVQALKSGNFFLFDEISLADDSVLERLNSVLEPERSLLLAEKGSSDSLITALDGFQFFATMNPGGDYGKKELSPALRNRFTEIWVPSMDDFQDVKMIVNSRLNQDLRLFTDTIVDFSEWFAKKLGNGDAKSGVISLRDILGWVEFMNKSTTATKDFNALLLHGALMIFIDTLGTNNTAYLAENEKVLRSLKNECVSKLSKLLSLDLSTLYSQKFDITITNERLSIGIFDLSINKQNATIPSFNLDAPTTSSNLMRVVRAMQVHRPILLEGSPGVGKTSLISALADLTGNKLTRINLSEQTDLVDLFGSDAPGEKSGEFVWKDAPFLRAMQQGEWVLLDEMNLASQSVLEGLNACLDHRGEAYIPELDKSFTCHPNFLVFAAQNPQYQGGGRKGLPKSFVNRFSVVYVDILSSDDLQLIANHLFPNLDHDLVSKIILLISQIEDEVTKKKMWGNSGAPWEFNLRDTLRWLKLLNKKSISTTNEALDFIEIIIKQRFRSESDKDKAQELVDNIFGSYSDKPNYYSFNKEYLQINNTLSSRNKFYQYPDTINLVPLQCNFKFFESALRCINNNWPLILTGPSGSGKSGLIKFLASILGEKVSFFSMNSDVDSMDILGGYEQVDLKRKISYIINDVIDYLRNILSINVSLQQLDRDSLMIALETLNFAISIDIIATNFEILKNKFQLLERYLGSNSEYQILLARMNHMSKLVSVEASVKFEWFDGMLVTAVEKGHWLVLDNANLCSPSVLDRLNSLLESEGSLIINECSLADGQPRVLKPHPNFKLFLTVDPKYGELSRAMRNRGIEIYMGPLSERCSTFDLQILNNASLLSNIGGLSNGTDYHLPLLYYVPSQCSSMFSFAQIHDIILKEPTKEALLSIFSAATFENIYNIEEWSNNIASYKIFSENSIVSEFPNFSTFLEKLEITGKIKSLYLETTKESSYLANLDSNYFDSQHLNLTLNHPLTKIIFNNERNLSEKELIYLFSSLKLAFDASNLLDNASYKSLNARIQDLSYLELSFANDNGRNIKSPPRIPIFKILKSLEQSIVTSLKEGNLFSNNNRNYKIWRFLIIWHCAFECATTKEEARLRVYKNMFQKWNEEAIDMSLHIADISPVINMFDDMFSLTRGASMPLLWEKYRTRYPQSAAGWNIWSTVEKLATQFDVSTKLQFSDAYSLISQLRDSMIILAEELLSDDTKDLDILIKNLESGLDQLNEISSKFLIKRNHIFTNEFDHLIRLMFNSIRSNNDDIKSLLSYSSIPTSSFIKLNTNSYSYPPIFDLLWKKGVDGRFSSNTVSFIGSDFIQKMLVKANNLHKSPGSQISQTLIDSEYLLDSTIKFSGNILENQIEHFDSSLKDWVKTIVQLHYKGDTPLSDDYTNIDLSFFDSYFAEVFSNYLEPILQNSSESLDIIGANWVSFGIALINLYAPNAPLDPAVEDHISFEVFEKHKQFTNELAQTWKNICSITSGDEKILIEEGIVCISSADTPAKPRVYRPKKSIDSMYTEWTHFLESSILNDQLQDLVKSLSMDTPKSFNRVDMFQQNSSHFLERLTTTFRDFTDVNEIFKGYIMSINFGFDLLKISSANKQRQSSLSTMWPIDPLILIDENKLENALLELNDFIKISDLNSLDIEELLVFFIKMIKFNKSTSTTLLNKVLQTLFYRWSMRQLKEEKEQENKSKLFKFSDDTDDYEADFRKMFPDYEDVATFSDLSVKSSEDNLKDTYFLLAKAYMDLFSNQDSASTIADTVLLGSRISEIMTESPDYFKSHTSNKSHLTSLINIFNNKIKNLKVDVSSYEINFYHGTLIPESQKAAVVMEELWKTTNNLLLQWPEHATLKEICRLCQEYLSFSIETPIFKLLQKIEQIYTFVSDWEKYASSKVSLSQHIRKLTDQIVSWRKLELHTWNNLFNFEDQTLEKNIGKWWFHLFETLIMAPSSLDSTDKERTNITEVVAALNIFFSKCPIGEFGYRIDLLKAFENHIKFSDNSAILHAVQNCLSFYSQFRPLVSQQIASSRKDLEKEVKEVILLASWKDVNVDALKQSSRRSHNSLFKLVRKYRELINTSVAPTIEGGLTFTKSNTKDNQLTVPHYRTLDLSNAKQIVSNIEGWDTRSNALKNIHTVSRNMISYIEKVENCTLPYLDELAKEFLKEADRLRSETPNVYTKDTKKKLAGLKAQKSKSLSDALKELKRIGLKSSFRKDIQQVQSSSTSILANSISFTSKSLENSDAYFFKLVDLLPRLRSHASNPKEDVPITSIERGLAICENLVFSLITTRSPISFLANIYDKIDLLRTNFESICFLKGEFATPKLRPRIDNIIFICEWLPKLIEYVSTTLSLITATTKESFPFDKLNNATNQLNNFASRASTFTLMDSDASTFITDFENFINDFVKMLNDKKSENTWPAMSILVLWLSQCITSPEDIESESLKIHELDESFKKVHTSILLTFQKLMELDTSSIEEEEDKWLSTSSSQLMKKIKIIEKNNIVRNLEFTLELFTTNIIDCDSLTAKSLACFTMPLINHYHTLVVRILEKAKLFYSKTSYGSYILAVVLDNLAKDGFCTPEPPSEEVDDKNLHEGTGLGDGEGAQNNSKDVEQDDDLTEDAQKPNDDQKDDKEEDEDDDSAVDMEGDMAGNLEDISDNEQSEPESQDEDDEEELDEEIDDLNDDDPNAVDEKMWNEEPEENSKEKDTDQNVDNPGDDEDVQGKDDDKPDSSNNDKENASKEEQENQNENDEENDREEGDSDGNASEGDDESNDEGVGEQEDEVKGEENESLQDNVPDVETMDLPEDMNLDSDGGETEDEDEKDAFEDEEDEDEDELSNSKKSEDVEEIPEENASDEMEDVDNEADGLEESEDENMENEDNSTGVVDEEANDESDGENMSEEEELLPEENENDNENSKENGGENNVDGLDGMEEDVADTEDVDMDASVQQNSGSKSSGSDIKNEEEQEDVGASGATSNAKEEEERDEDSSNQNDARDDAKETLKQLGESMKEFHRRRQEIKEATKDEDENPENNSANERPDEFEHVDADNQNSKNETQAMGSANQDQIQDINEDMAIDDDDEDVEMKDAVVDETPLESVEKDTNENNSADAENDETNGKGGFIGERKQDSIMDKSIHDALMQAATNDDLDNYIEEIDQETHDEVINEEPPRTREEAIDLWHKSELSTSDLVSRLGEQLRLILEPTLATKLRGDYKTGKRLNMKRIIPYIASQFRKDKIWLRRTKPSKRQYQIMISIDDSKSMSESNCVKLAFDSLYLVSKTLTQLESGGLSIVKFGERVKELHSFDQQFSDDAGCKVFQSFGFQETKTDIKRLVAESFKIFERSRASNDSDNWQLQIILSDGVCEDHATVERLVRRARENKIMLVFVIIDGINSNESIMDMSQVKYVPDQNGNMKLQIDKYLDTFPFEFYVVVHNVSELPEMLSVILRQYFSELSSST